MRFIASYANFFTWQLPESTMEVCPFHVASSLLICKIGTVMWWRGALVLPFNTWGGGGGGGRDGHIIQCIVWCASNEALWDVYC